MAASVRHGFGVLAFVLVLLSCEAMAQGAASTTGAELQAKSDSSQASLNALAMATLFELKLEFPESRESGGKDRKKVTPRRVQLGFLVGGDGLAVTSFSGMRLAHDASVRLGESKSVYRVHYLGSDPRADLALIRLELKKSSAGKSKGTEERTPLDTFLSPSTEQASSWKGEANDHGRVSAPELYALVREYASGVSKAIPLSLLLSSDSDSLIAIHQLNGARCLLAGTSPCSAADLSGTPIVNSAGALVGWWAWDFPAGKASVRALPSAPIQALIEEHGAKKRKLENEETGKENNERVTALVFPRLEWPEGGNAEKIVSKLSESCICGYCEDDGLYDPKEFRIVGNQKEWLPRQPCPKCGRTKLMAFLDDPGRIWEELSKAAAHIGAAPNDKREGLLSKLEEQVAKIARYNREGFVDALNNGAREAMQLVSLSPVQPGTPVALVLGVGEWVEAPAKGWGGEDVRVVGVRDVWHLVLTAPRGRSVNWEREQALVLGVVSGVVTDSEQVNWTVIDRACVVPISTEPR